MFMVNLIDLITFCIVNFFYIAPSIKQLQVMIPLTEQGK